MSLYRSEPISMQQPGAEKGHLEERLYDLPDQVAAFLLTWRTKTLELEKYDAKKTLRLRVENPTSTATEIKAMVYADDERFNLALEEAKAEAQYTKVYETLLATKTIARIREAF